jgi:hypothetical protein
MLLKILVVLGFVFVATLAMASQLDSSPAANLEAGTGTGTRNILMYDYYDPTRQTILVKFPNVPVDYDIMDIKHVDHVGMYWTFSNKETWLTLEGKRLFMAGAQGIDPVGPESAEDWPIMSPEELHEALKSYEPYEMVAAKWQAVVDRHFSNAAATVVEERDY